MKNNFENNDCEKIGAAVLVAFVAIVIIVGGSFPSISPTLILVILCESILFVLLISICVWFSWNMLNSFKAPQLGTYRIVSFKEYKGKGIAVLLPEPKNSASNKKNEDDNPSSPTLLFYEWPEGSYGISYDEEIHSPNTVIVTGSKALPKITVCLPKEMAPEMAKT